MAGRHVPGSISPMAKVESKKKAKARDSRISPKTFAEGEREEGEREGLSNVSRRSHIIELVLIHRDT